MPPEVINKLTLKRASNKFSKLQKKLPLVGNKGPLVIYSDAFEIWMSVWILKTKPCSIESRNHPRLKCEVMSETNSVQSKDLTNTLSGWHSWISIKIDYNRSWVLSPLEAIYFAEFTLLFLCMPLLVTLPWSKLVWGIPVSQAKLRTTLLKEFWNCVLFFKQGRTYVLIVEPLIPLFRISGDSDLGFKSRLDPSFACFVVCIQWIPQIRDIYSSFFIIFV